MFCLSPSPGLPVYNTQYSSVCKVFFEYFLIFLSLLNCKMKLELRNWDKGACPFIPIRAAAGPYSQFL